MASSSRTQGRATPPLPNKVSEVREAAPDTTAYVDWAAVLAGVFVSTASALLLAGVGAALGLSLRPDDTSAETVGLAAAVWLGLITLYAAGVGGYISGRLRVNNSNSPEDEISFRDGVNGLVVWGLGIILSGLLATATISGAARTVAATGSAVTTAAAGAVGAAVESVGSVDYLIDRALRVSDAPAQGATGNPEQTRAEISRIITASVARGSVSNEDKQYLTQLVSTRTGIPQADAERRIDALTAEAQAAATQATEAAKAAAEKAEKAATFFAIYSALAAFLAGVLAWFAARIGGHHRDDNF